MLARRLLAVTAGLLLLGGGIAGAVALTTGTVSVCTASHTIKVDNTAVSTIAAQCVTTTYQVPTATVTNTVTGPTNTVTGPTTTVTNTVTSTQTVTVTNTTTTTPTPASPGGYGIIAWGGTLSNYSAAHQQGAALISVNAGPDATAAAALPGRSTIYMDADLIRQDGGSGVSWSEASANGYLEPAGDPSYPGTTYAKIDAPGYATWFANKAVALAKQYGVDGIWLDDASASGNPYYTPTTQKAAIKAIVQALGAALHANGLYLMASANGYESGNSGSDDGTLHLAWWESLAPYVDGITNEYWQELASDQITMRSRGTNWNQHWDDWQAAVAKFHADFPSKDFSGLVYGPTSNHVYGRASLALADPNGIFVGNQGSSDVIAASWATCPNPAVDPVAVTARCTLGSALPARMSESAGGSLYVSLSGNDSNPGTLASPFRTVLKAFNVASNGTTIYVRGGTYPDSVQLYNKKFSATNPVTVTNYPGETAKFTGDGLIDMFYFSNDTGIRVRGLELANNSDTMAGTQAGSAGAAIGLKVYDSQDIELDHLFVHNNGSTVGGQGVLVSGGDGCTTCTHDYIADVQLWNSRFTANGKDPAGQHSVYFGGGKVGPLGTESNNVIANNVIYDQPNGYALHIGDNADGVYIVNNTIYHTFGYQYGAAMALWNEGPDQSVNTHDLKVYNNLMVDNNNGIAGSGWVSQANNIVDYNYASGTVGTGAPCTPNCSYSTMYGTDVTLYTLGTHNTVGSDPMFVSKAGHDFHLQSGSRALGMANPAYAPALDADGQARPVAPAMGAFG